MMKNRIVRLARNVLPIIAEQAVLGLIFLGVIVAVSGCEFVYLPECDSDCTAGGGNDSYGRNTP